MIVEEKVNNATIILDKNNNNFCSFAVFWKAGSLFDPIKKEGLAHLLEHIKFTFDNVEMEKMGLTVNALTSFENVYIYGTFLTEDSENAISYLLDSINKPLHISDELFDKEKITILNEKKETFVDTISWQARQSILWREHALGGDFFGTKETLSNISLNDIFEFNENYYSKSNTVFSFVGNIDIDFLKDEIKKYTAPNQIADLSSDFTKENKEVSRFNLEDKESDFFKVNLSFKVPYVHKLYPYILRDIYSNFWTSLLNHELRVSKNFSYWVTGYADIFSLSNTGYISFEYQVSKENLEISIKQSLLAINDDIENKMIEHIKKLYMLRVLSKNEDSLSQALWNGESVINYGRLTSVGDYAKEVLSVDRDDLIDYWNQVKKTLKVIIINSKSEFFERKDEIVLPLY